MNDTPAHRQMAARGKHDTPYEPLHRRPNPITGQIARLRPSATSTKETLPEVVAQPRIPVAENRFYREKPQPPQLPITGVGNIAKAISGVMSEVGTIEKGGENKFHNYKYARMEDLLVVLTPLMGKHGLAIIQNEIEKSLVESRATVLYEFSIIHESGEIWPERPRFTGMSVARDSKGQLDDKAINKCHTAARKYFLLGLFQVPAGDFDDADPGSQQQPKAPVTGPGPTPTGRPEPAPTKPQPIPTPVIDESKPHRISLPKGSGPSQWATKYIQAIENAASADELRQWDELNDQTLQHINDKYQDLYNQHINPAVSRRMEQLETQVAEHIDPETGEITTELADPGIGIAMPDPNKDMQATMNWVAQNLSEFKTYEAAERFWNTIVSPREPEFFPPDFEVLLQEFRRAEARLAGK